MAVGPEIVIGAIACVLCSISGAACLLMNGNHQRGGNCCGPSQENPAYLGRDLDLQELAMLQAVRIEQLEAYIQRNAQRERQQEQPRRGVHRIFRRRRGAPRQPAAAAAPAAQPVPPANNAPPARPGVTNILIPQTQGLGGITANIPPVQIPYLNPNQLRHYPHAGFRVV
jgi:hypothetical protein